MSRIIEYFIDRSSSRSWAVVLKGARAARLARFVSIDLKLVERKDGAVKKFGDRNAERTDDERHRFAVQYHSLLKRKSALE